MRNSRNRDKRRQGVAPHLNGIYTGYVCRLECGWTLPGTHTHTYTRTCVCVYLPRGVPRRLRYQHLTCLGRVMARSEPIELSIRTRGRFNSPLCGRCCFLDRSNIPTLSPLNLISRRDNTSESSRLLLLLLPIARLSDSLSRYRRNSIIRYRPRGIPACRRSLFVLRQLVHIFPSREIAGAEKDESRVGYSVADGFSWSHWHSGKTGFSSAVDDTPVVYTFSRGVFFPSRVNVTSILVFHSTAISSRDRERERESEYIREIAEIAELVTSTR